MKLTFYLAIKGLFWCLPRVNRADVAEFRSERIRPPTFSPFRLEPSQNVRGAFDLRVDGSGLALPLKPIRFALVRRSTGQTVLESFLVRNLPGAWPSSTIPDLASIVDDALNYNRLRNYYYSF